MNDMKKITKKFLTTIDALKTQDTFPKRMIANTHKYSYVSDFDVFLSENFFRAIKSQLRLELDYFLLVIAIPDPFEYFWKHFNRIPTIKIDRFLEFKDYIRLLNMDPGGSPADAIIHNCTQVVIADNTFERIFIFMRDQEVGVGYFTDYATMENMKKMQNFGIIDPTNINTIPNFLRSYVKKYEKEHHPV